jgi:hypothetical protein
MRKIIQYAQMYIGFLNSVKTKGGDDANLWIWVQVLPSKNI